MWWRDDFMVEYYGAGAGSGCMGEIHPPPGQQLFLHGKFSVTIFISIADCHNNTFIAVRTINKKHNNVYVEFYSTGQ